MSPGQGVDKSILSTADLKSHTDNVHEWGPQELVKALTNDGFSAKMKNPHRNEDESLCDLICFGSSEVCTKDEFKIEPRYAHKKNLDKPEKKIMSWKWIIIEH